MIEELTKCGIPREKLIPRGFGLVYPSHSNDAEATRMLNRRVVLQGDCPNAAARGPQTPCRYKPPSESAGAGSGSRTQTASSSEGGTTTFEQIDTSDHDAQIAELADMIQESESSGPPLLPLPFGPIGIMIPMGKSTEEGKPLPPGFKRTGPETTQQSLETGPKVGKGTDPTKVQEQKRPEQPSRALPKGFKKTE